MFLHCFDLRYKKIVVQKTTGGKNKMKEIKKFKCPICKEVHIKGSAAYNQHLRLFIAFGND